MQVLRNVRVSQGPLSASRPVCKLQRINADEVGQAGVQNGSFGHRIGLETPGQSESHGAEAMGLACVIGEKGLVELDTDDVGYVCDGEVESFVWIEIGHGTDVGAVRA